MLEWHLSNVTHFSGALRRSSAIAALLLLFLLGMNGCATDYEDFNPDPVPEVNPESAPHESVGNLPPGPPSPTPRNPFNQPVNPFGH
jgi:hypothetical protein